MGTDCEYNAAAISRCSSNVRTNGIRMCCGCQSTRLWGRTNHYSYLRQRTSRRSHQHSKRSQMTRQILSPRNYKCVLASKAVASNGSYRRLTMICVLLCDDKQPNFLITSSAVHGAQLDFQFECPAPPILLRFSLIRNLPLLMTPLAASLSRQEFGENVRRSGYLTLDRARKAVPVLKTDPLILQRPMVGVWVYGVTLSEDWEQSTARAQLADPQLYFACLGYVLSRTIKEKAELSKNTFLVAIYPSGSASQDGQRQVSPLPRFFECSCSELLSSQSPIPIDLYAQQRSCLVGVSSFAADLEFKLSSSPCEEWESARQQLGISTIPVSREEDVTQQDGVDDEQVQASRSGNSFEADRATRSFSRVKFAEHEEETKEGDASSVFRQSSGSRR